MDKNTRVVAAGRMAEHGVRVADDWSPAWGGILLALEDYDERQGGTKLDWFEVWKKAARDPAWGPALESIWALEWSSNEAGKVTEAMRRVKKWIRKTISRTRTLVSRG